MADPVPELRGRSGMRVWHEMLTDPQVESVMSAITHPLLAARWHLLPAEGGEEHAELIGGDLGLPVGTPDAPTVHSGWSETLQQLVTALGYGVSIHELIVAPDNGRAKIEDLVWREPWGIEGWDLDGRGRVESVTHCGVKLSANRIMHWAHKRPVAGPWGRPVLRAAWEPWRRKAEALRVQGIAAERNSLGVPVYTGAPMPEGLTQEQADEWAAAEAEDGLKLARALRSGATAGVYVPNGASLRLIGVEGDLVDVTAIIQQHDEQIARATLAHLLTLGTQTGSWALGAQFAELLASALQSMAGGLAAAVQSVVDRVTEWSWPGSRSAQVSWVAIDRSTATVVESVEKLARSGVLTPGRSLEESMRDRLGLPKEV